jgi:hypothetical protein
MEFQFFPCAPGCLAAKAFRAAASRSGTETAEAAFKRRSAPIVVWPSSL